MPARVFVDTNIWLYALIQSDDAQGDMQHGQQIEGQLTIVNPLQA